MKMKTSVKIGLYATFGLGFIDLAVGSCLRYVWIRWSITNVTLAALGMWIAALPRFPICVCQIVPVDHGSWGTNPVRLEPENYNRLVLRSRPVYLPDHRLPAAP